MSDSSFADWPDPQKQGALRLKRACEAFGETLGTINEPIAGIDEKAGEDLKNLWRWIERAGPSQCGAFAENLYPLIQRPTHQEGAPSYGSLLADRAIADIRDALDTLRGEASPPARLDVAVSRVGQELAALRAELVQINQTATHLNAEAKVLSDNSIEVNFLSVRAGDINLNIDLSEFLIHASRKVVDILALDRLARRISTLVGELWQKARHVSDNMARLIRLLVRRSLRVQRLMILIGDKIGHVLDPPPNLSDDLAADLRGHFELEESFAENLLKLEAPILDALRRTKTTYRLGSAIPAFVLSGLEIPADLNANHVASLVDRRAFASEKKYLWICPAEGEVVSPRRHEYIHNSGQEPPATGKVKRTVRVGVASQGLFIVLPAIIGRGG